MRTPIIAGNWKMHNSVEEALHLVKSIQHGFPWPGDIDVIVAPPFTALTETIDVLKTSYISIAAQNLHHEDKGAFTGEISGVMLNDIGIDYVLVGHSERRQLFNETDEIVNQKITAALRHQLTPIICIGETLEEREANQVEEVLYRQLSIGLNGFSKEEAKNFIIAYEPIWAIGTGKTATPEQAEEAHQLIREMLAKQFNRDTAETIRILYGGSVKPSNSKALLSQPNIDGALVGGASLKANDFIEIIKST